MFFSLNKKIICSKIYIFTVLFCRIYYDFISRTNLLQKGDKSCSLLKTPVQEMWPKHHPNHTGDDKQHPEDDSQQLHTEQCLLALLYDFLLTHQARRRAVRPVWVHLLHPQADCGQDDEAGVPAVALQGEHHPLGDCGQAGRHGHGKTEGHGGQPGQDAGVAG